MLRDTPFSIPSRPEAQRDHDMARPPLVLVVDDDVDVARSLHDALVDAGFRVVVAHDGEMALAECIVEDPAVIVLDVLLPGMSGVQFLERYRHRRRTRAMVIAVSAVIGPEAQGLPVHAFIGKPFDIEDLVARVREFAPGTFAS